MGCSFRSKHHGDTSQDPLTDVLLLALHLEIGSENEGCTTCRGCVAGACVHCYGRFQLSSDSSDVDDGDDGMKLFELLFN